MAAADLMVSRAAAAGILLLCAACDRRSAGNHNDVDIARAAEEAQESVDNYATVRERVTPKSGTAVVPSRSRPRPAPSPVSTTVTEARYTCAGMDDIGIRFDNRHNSATLRLPEETVSLALRGGGEAPFYAGHGYEFHGEGREATLIRPDAPSVTCSALS